MDDANDTLWTVLYVICFIQYRMVYTAHMQFEKYRCAQLRMQ